MSTRDLSQPTPSLFDVVPPPAVSEVPEDTRQERQGGNCAKDFIRWCFSFGDSFRNSPDINNLRYWLQKNKLKLENGEEVEVLEAARRLFFKRIEQISRQSDQQ